MTRAVDPNLGQSTQPPPLPEWYPAWAKALADLYYSGSTCVFVVHGNVRDLVRAGPGPKASYTSLLDFLATQLFGSWNVVVQFDLAAGIRPRAGADAQRLQTMMQYLGSRLGDATSWPRDADNALLRLDRLLERNLLEENAAQRRSIGLLLDYAQYLVPAGDAAAGGRSGANLVRLLGWAANPYLKRVNTAICLVADSLSDVHERLVQSPHVATIEIPMPDVDARKEFIESGAFADGAAAGGFSSAELADASNGLSLVSLSVMLAQAAQAGRGLDPVGLKPIKKSMIERQCRGLLEFVEPKHKLDLVVGNDAAKLRLQEDAAMLLHGKSDTVPMGYLICGPVGTGKTFLAECYAGSIGIPCVKLRNFRSKYVGETEGNLEQVLTVLRSLGPVVVIIDEADAALGNRDAGGDSGTSSRVFSMIASQMGDTRYRGRIVWMLLTCRPDLLPIDLKRQGRAEVHLPLFYPQDQAEVRAMFDAMARKNRVPLQSEMNLAALPKWKLSGADLESVLLLARRAVTAAGRSEVTGEDIAAALADFIPSVQGLEKELQEVAAVLECTQLSLLPAEWRKRVGEPDGRTQLQERLVELRRLIEE